MQSRNRCWRTPLLVITVFLLMAAPFVTLAAGNRSSVIRQQQPKSSEDGPGMRPAFTPPESVPIKKPTLFPRTERFWTFESGPDYGRVPAELTNSPDVIVTPVGSFITKGAGLAFPRALKGAEVAALPAYYIIQFTPSAFAPDQVSRTLENVTKDGAQLIAYVPNNAYVVKMAPAAYSAVAGSGLVQFVQHYHAGYKIMTGIGTAPLPDPERAASPIYSLTVSGFPGTTSAEIAAQITALGGTITVTDDTESGPHVFADLNKDQITTLAQYEGIRMIEENLPRISMGEESSWNVIAGTYIIGVKPNLYLAGVNGSGRYLKDVNNAPLGAGDPRAAGAEDVDWNGNGVIDNAAQIIADTDTGMAVDAGDFSESATSSGWTGAGGLLGPNVSRLTAGGQPLTHRKIAWYFKATGGFGVGDTNSCDPAGSHGTVTSGQAAGNASSGPFAADGIDWSGDGTTDDYGDPNPGDLCGPGFCFTSGAQTFRVDGVAPGARIVFEDVNGTCPEPTSFAFGSYATMLGDARAKGARLHTFSFGAFNPGTGTQYDSSAVAIDTFLATDANRDYMMFVAAGNNGSATQNTGAGGKDNTLSNEAASKNALVIGANNSGNLTALLARAGFSSIGPAPNGNACSGQTSAVPASSSCGRIKPDLMAPGSDGNSGLAESYNCVSNDNDQLNPIQCLNLGGNSGTSFSTPNAAGAGALIRDYFVQGLYPDGTSSNANNNGDRVSKMSGAMVKALLIASANDMTGGGLHPAYAHRFNPETGYGFVNLRKVLPLTTDPLTPTGLVVKDGACPTGVTTCPDNLGALTSPLAPGASTSVQFDVLDKRQELRIALAWIEAVDGLNSGALVTNLDLELRYCGADNNCATNGGDVVYYGNVFTEDRDDDGTEDQNLDGTVGIIQAGAQNRWRSEGSWSIPNRGDPPSPFIIEATRDAQNTNEAIFLSPDPEVDGTDAAHDSDNQLKTGRYQLTVKNNNAAFPNAVSQKYAVVLAGGIVVDSSIRLDTNPISCNGEVGVIVSEVAKASTIDPLCNTTNLCTSEANIEGRTKITVKSTSGTQVDLEQASGAKARFNLTKDPNTLSFASGKIPVSSIANINADDDILVAGDGYTVTATYTDQDCTADGTAGCQNTVAERIVKTSESTFDCTPNVDFFAIGQPGRNSVFLLAGGCDDDKYMDNGEVFTYLIQFGNLEDTLTLDDVTVTMRAVTPDGCVGGGNAGDECSLNAECPGGYCDNAPDHDPGRLNNASSPYVTVANGTQFIDKVEPGFLESAGFTVSVSGAPSWGVAPAAPPEVELVVGITSQKAGKSAATYGAFKHLLNADDETFLYSSDYPSGAIVDRDMNSNEKIENPIRDRNQPFPLGTQRDNFDKLNESITFSDMTATGFGGGNPGFNGPWDFDGNDENFRSGLYSGSKGNTAEITLWGEDKDYDGSLSGPYICLPVPGTLCTCAGNPPAGCTNSPECGAGVRCIHTEDFDGDQDGTLDEGWSLAGGCGYNSHNGANRGVWHTGQIGQVGATTCNSNVFPTAPLNGTAPSCENADTVPGTTGNNLWLEFLRTPVIQKVHKNPDNRALDYRVELRDLRWNINADFEPDLVGMTWEWDEDTTSLDPVDLGDGIILRNHNDGMGPINGANVNLTRGFPMFSDNDPDDDVPLFGQKASFGCTALPTTACTCPAGVTGCNAAPCAAQVGVCVGGSNAGVACPATACAGGGVCINCTVAKNGSAGRNRSSDRSCLFESLTSAQVGIVAKLLREPKPIDDDCSNDIVSLGPDGCPGKCGFDDDGDGATDNPEEACPCYAKQDGIDDDGDTRKDEQDELQRFYRCQGAPTTFCNVTPSGSCVGGPTPGAGCSNTTACGVGGTCSVPTGNADDCGGSGPCGHFGDGKPKPYGDDVCGDGSVDEGVSEKWASETALGENGHRIAQNQNWNIGTLNGPFLRFATLEDTYDSEAGTSFQGAFGYLATEGTLNRAPKAAYGLAIDDVTVEWAESHPIEQAAAAGCGTKTCSGGPRAGKLCFNTDDCGVGGTCTGAVSTGSSCAALTWGVTNLFAGSGVVSLNLVDFNADTTQGGFNCTIYGFTVGCGGGNCSNSNDCDNDGLKEVQVTVKTPSEPSPELIRMEQSSSGSPSYSALVSVSSAINAAGDGVAFLQYNGVLTPSVAALYFDKDSGAGDLNGDGTVDGPPNVGKDGCPGFCGVDDDQDAVGLDKRPGNANQDDDGNGQCDYKSLNVGAPCTVDSNCNSGGACLNVDEQDELCGRVCTAGATSGLCSRNSVNAGTVCTTPGATGICTGGGTCIAINCTANGDCGGGGNCNVTKVQRGDDNCANIDEPDEVCAVVSGKLASGIDDNCGCVDNPVTAVLNTSFNVADIIVQDYTLTDNGDNDGFADDNELVTASLTLRNLSSFDVDNVIARITTQDSTIQCINDPQAKYGRINSLSSANNGPDLLRFTVATVGRTALSDIKQAKFTVTITGTAILEDGSRVQVEGTATPQTFTVDLDLDVNGAAPPAAKTTKLYTFENGGGSGQYASDAAWNADWAHTFFETQSGLHCQYNYPGNPGARSAPVGCFLRQDPGTTVVDDWHLHSTVHSGGVPDAGRDSGAPGTCAGGSVPGASCLGDSECPGKCLGGKVPGELCYGVTSDCRGACSGGGGTTRCTTNTECSTQGLGKCNTPAPGTCTNPAQGSCTGQGSASMHLGVHPSASVTQDTIHLDNIFYAYAKVPYMIGLGRAGTDDRPQLDFWQQMSETDNRIFSNLSPPYSLGACTVQALIDRNNDGTLQVGPPTTASNDGWWEKLVPFYGVPAQQRFPAGNCTYDPNDDGNTEADLFESGNPTFQFSASGTQIGPSSTCFPEFIWACAGDTTDPPYDPQTSGAPDTVCFTEVTAGGDPIVREGAGPGRWIETKFDLYRYRGRPLWIRYLVSDVQFGFDTWGTGFGGTGVGGGNRDDGWYLDDIKLTGLNAAPFLLKADSDPPPVSGCPVTNCSTVTARMSGSTFVTQHNLIDDDVDGTIDEVDEGKFNSVTSDAPLRNIFLNAQDPANPTTSDCLNGVLQYRFWVDSNGNGTAEPTEIFRDFTENPQATANSACQETIRMDVRCTAPAPNSCTGAANTTLAVTVTGQVGGLTGTQFSGIGTDPLQTCNATASVNPKNCFEWSPVNQTARYDISSRLVNVNAGGNTWTGNGGLFDGMTCRAGNPTGAACVDADGDGKCEFNTTAIDVPTTTSIAIWLVRQDTGSWNELGSVTGLGAPYSRDTDMINGTPVCP